MDEKKAEYNHDFFDLPPLERKQHRTKKEKNQPMALWKMLLIILICLLFGMGSYFVGQVYGVELIPPDEVNPLPNDVVSGATDGKPDTSPILNILMMGVDQRDPNEPSRADMVALVAMNLETKEINMISIPRDTRAEIAGTNLKRKINYAHATGGSERMVSTVEDLLDVNVHYYVETNFEGFTNCVDILGGVPMDVEARMYVPLEGIDLKAGQQTLNGEEALSYVRWRGDKMADISRIQRQQKFLKTLMDQSLRLTTITKVPSLIATLQRNVETDMTAAQMVALAKQFMNVDDLNLKSFTLPGLPDEENYGASYWIIDQAETKAILQGIYEPKLTPDEGLVAENKEN